MNPARLRSLLERVKDGDLPVDEALSALAMLPFEDVGVATVDHHRALRQGSPEVIFGEGKSAEQILSIVTALLTGGHNVLVTRMDAGKAAEVAARHPALRYAEAARIGVIEQVAPAARPCAPVAVLCAGTSDIAVAEEACETLASVGLGCTRLYDVGVAGIHRLFDRAGELAAASAVIVIAGMEGALPSVVGGIVSCPVIAVPTSVGYGTALGGFTALFSMLTSCASGITVVNIDNGFGAAMAVHRMMPRAPA